MFKSTTLVAVTIVGILTVAWVALGQEAAPSRQGRGDGMERGWGRGAGGLARVGFGPLSLLAPMDAEQILRQYPQADTDGDGKLSPAEHRAFMTGQRAALEKELLTAHPGLDTDADGALSPEEKRAGAKEIEEFVAAKVLASNPEADKDGDGQLSREELRSFQARRMGARQPSPATSIDWVMENFDRIDANSDGQLSIEELRQFRRQFGSDRPGGRMGVGAGTREQRGEPDAARRRSGEGRGPRDGQQRGTGGRRN